MHNEKLCNVYSIPNIITMINYRMEFTKYVTHVKDVRNAHKVLLIELKERDSLENLGINVSLLLELISKKEGEGLD